MSKDDLLLNGQEESSIVEVVPVGPETAPLKLRLAILACICCLTLGSYWVFEYVSHHELLIMLFYVPS